MIWVNVALPPNENGMTNAQARFPNSQLTHAEVKRQKIEILRYCLGFVYAVKHYLRGEDGADYGDLTGVLPPHFSVHGDLGYTTNHSQPSVLPYAAMQGSTSDASISDRRSVDATKRVKRKRSKKNVDPQTYTPGPATPLLSDSYQTVEFHPYADHISMPLPLMFVFYEVVALHARFIKFLLVSPMKLRALYSGSNGKDCWRQLALQVRLVLDSTRTRLKHTSMVKGPMRLMDCELLFSVDLLDAEDTSAGFSLWLIR